MDEVAHLVESNETALRYAFVDPTLRALGWKIWPPWECQPKFCRGRRRSGDYALFDRDDYPAVLIEVGTTGAPRRQVRFRLCNAHGE